MTECLIDCNVGGGGGRIVLNSCFHKKRKSLDSHVCNLTDEKSFQWDAVLSIVFHPVLATPLLKSSFSSHFIQKKKKKERKKKENNIVFFLLGDSPAPEFYVSTFRNTLSVPSSQVV